MKSLANIYITHQITDDNNVEEKKGISLFNVKYPKIFKKGSSKDAEATLASMETLEDKLDTPNDGMENVKLDPEVSNKYPNHEIEDLKIN